MRDGDAAAAHEALADIYIGLLDRDRAAEELEATLRARPGDERLRKKLEGVRLPVRQQTGAGRE